MDNNVVDVIKSKLNDFKNVIKNDEYFLSLDHPVIFEALDYFVLEWLPKHTQEVK